MLMTGDTEANDTGKRFLLSLQHENAADINVYTSDLALNPSSLPHFVIRGILKKPSHSLSDLLGKMGEEWLLILAVFNK